MLVIEGPDCVGKTTFCSRVAEMLARLPLGRRLGRPPIVHLGQEGRSWGAEAYAAASRPWTVRDRFHLSEQAYGALRTEGPNPVALRAGETALGWSGGLVVVLVPSNRAAWRTRLAADAARQHFSVGQCERALDGYRLLLEAAERTPWRRTPWFVCPVDPFPTDDLAARVATAYASRQVDLIATIVGGGR